MRSFWRTPDQHVGPIVLPVVVPVALIGVSYGALATGSGFALAQVLVLAVTVLAGSSELLFVGLVATGTAPPAAALAGLMVNVRNSAYGVAVSPLLRSVPQRLVGAHLVNDESAALATAQETPATARRVFWAAGIGIALAWPLGALAGAGIGQIVPDPHTWGLDAVFPAVIAALAIPALRDRRTLAAAVVGGAVAVVATAYVPQGIAPVLALVGLVVAYAGGRRRRR